jgi:hypothetical protein
MVRRRDCPSEAWLTLLEKAFAQYVGGYPKLNGGFPFAALEALTGDPVRVYAYDDGKGRWAVLEHDTDVAAAAAATHAPPPRVSAQLEHDALWTLVKEAFEAGHLIAAGTEGVIQSGQEDRQAYCIVELHEIGDLRLLCVRNPWGSFHWKGDWSEESELWDSRPDVTSVVNPVLETDSEFYISFDDFRHSFYQLYVCARGTGRNTSLRFLTQAAFTEPAVLAKQQGAALAMRRAGTKRFYGVSSCLPRSRMVIERIGATAGNIVNRLNANAGMLAGACASVARKGHGSHGIVSPAEAATSLDDDSSALGAPAAMGAPAAGGTVIGRPWAAVAALRSYLRPGSTAAAGAGAAEGGDASGTPAVGAPAAPAAGGAAGGTVLGYAVWPSARWGNRPGPVTILRAYWRGEPLPTTSAAPAAAAAAAAADGAPAAGGASDAPAARDMRAEAEGTPMVGRPVAAAGAAAAGAAAASAAPAGAEDAVVGVPPMPVPALPVARPGHMRAPGPPGAAVRMQASGDGDDSYDEPFGSGSSAGPSGSAAPPPAAAAPPAPAAAPAAPASMSLEERAAARLAQRLAAVQGLGPPPVDINGI